MPVFSFHRRHHRRHRPNWTLRVFRNKCRQWTPLFDHTHPRPMPCALRLPVPWVRGPVSHAVPTVLSHCARRRRAPRGVASAHPRWASAGERSSLSRSHPSNFLLDRPATPDWSYRRRASRQRCRAPCGFAPVLWLEPLWPVTLSL